MSKLVTGARILLGLLYFVFGLNGFLNFIPVPPMPDNIKVFMDGMMSAPYFFPVLKGSEVICGVMLLIGWQVPLALLILAPITLQIFLFHWFMTPGISNQVMPIALLALGIIVARGYWKNFRPLFIK